MYVDRNASRQKTRTRTTFQKRGVVAMVYGWLVCQRNQQTRVHGRKKKKVEKSEQQNWTETGDVGDAEDNPYLNCSDGSWEERLGNTPLNNSHVVVDAVVVGAVVVVVVVAVLGALLL